MSDFLIDQETISWKKGERSLTVRGLSPRDLTFLMRNHRETIERLFNRAESEQLQDDQSLTAFGWELMEEFPEMVALMIALAADMPDRAGEVSNLPTSVQLEAMMAVYKLTVEDTGGLERFLNLVLALFSKIRTEMKSMPSMNSLNSSSENTGT